LGIYFGNYTKEEFDKKEYKRRYYMYRRGWKVTEIISISDYLPQDDKIKEMIEFSKNYLNTGHSWINFDIDNKKIICSQFEKYYDFGDLRKITKNDLLVSD
jgi:hypothetical protein